MAALKETVSSQNQIIGDLQELLLKKQGVNIDSQSEVAQSRVYSQAQNESLDAYLFNDK